MWLNTHWISRPGVTTWSNGQTGLSNQRWTPVIGEARMASRCASAGSRSRSDVGNQARAPGRTGRPGRRSRRRAIRPSGAPRRRSRRRHPARSTRTPVVSRTVDAMIAKPALQPRAVELAQRNQRQLRAGTPSGCGGSRRGRPCVRGRRPSARAARSGPRRAPSPRTG